MLNPLVIMIVCTFVFSGVALIVSIDAHRLTRSIIDESLIEIVLFDENDLVIESIHRKIIPEIGHGIILGCGDWVEVLAISHDWDEPDIIKMSTKAGKIKE